jgi:hypothetical protein
VAEVLGLASPLPNPRILPTSASGRSAHARYPPIAVQWNARRTSVSLAADAQVVRQPERRSMCLAVFIASDQPLPLVGWDEAEPAFNVMPVSEHEEVVRRQFSLAYAVYAGAHTGCSCGFRSDDEDPASLAQSRAALLKYIEEAAATGPVEVFACWEGDWAESPRTRAERSFASLAREHDWLEELAFTRIPGLAS